MKYSILNYTKLEIPAPRGERPKIVHCPLLNTKLYHRQEETMFHFPAVVDSGADFCVFPAKFGKLIGLNVPAGRSIVTNGIGGQETLFFHRVSVGVFIREELWKFKAEVGFSRKMDRRGVGLLGRQGFFSQFAEVSFNETKKMFRIKEQVG